MITEKEYQKRKKQIKAAIGSVEAEGLIVTDETKEELDKWLYGDIESKDILKKMIEKYTKH